MKNVQFKITLDKDLVADDGTEFERQAHVALADQGDWVIGHQAKPIRSRGNLNNYSAVLTPKQWAPVRGAHRWYVDTFGVATGPYCVSTGWESAIPFKTQQHAEEAGRRAIAAQWAYRKELGY